MVNDGDWPSPSDVRVTGFDSWTVFEVTSGDARMVAARAYRTAEDGSGARTSILEVFIADSQQPIIRVVDDKPYTLTPEITQAIAADLNAMQQQTGTASGALHPKSTLLERTGSTLLCWGDDATLGLLSIGAGFITGGEVLICDVRTGGSDDCIFPGPLEQWTRRGTTSWSDAVTRRCGDAFH
jgi:hypothetical protein